MSTVKIGLELYLRYGPAVVATVRGGSGVQVFLDLKLHDIPNTVAGAARAVSKLRPEILTVHAAGGADMIKAAVEAAPDAIVAGVTLLTSIGDKDLAELGMDGSVSDAVRRMAALAVSAGARGLVCSPQEVAAVRAEVGPDILLITPGIRLAGRHERRPGQGRHPGGGAQGGRGPPGDRPPHHQGRPTPVPPRPRSRDPCRAARPSRRGDISPRRANAAAHVAVRQFRGGARAPVSRRQWASPAIWVADGGRRGHTGIKCFLLTVDVFGVTNSTCDDSSQLHCDRNAAVGKMSFRDKVSVEHPGL